MKRQKELETESMQLKARGEALRQSFVTLQNELQKVNQEKVAMLEEKRKASEELKN